MGNRLVLKDIGEKFKNRFGLPSMTVTFYDPTNKFEKRIFIHHGHVGDYGIWRNIEKNGYGAKFFGEIKEIPINEDLIRRVPAYKDVKILSFKQRGIFIIIKYSKASEERNLVMALKNQLWQYIKTEGELFDPYELPDEQ
jgi:hypothetical protein